MSRPVYFQVVSKSSSCDSGVPSIMIGKKFCCCKNGNMSTILDPQTEWKMIFVWVLKLGHHQLLSSWEIWWMHFELVSEYGMNQSWGRSSQVWKTLQQTYHFPLFQCLILPCPELERQLKVGFQMRKRPWIWSWQPVSQLVPSNTFFFRSSRCDCIPCTYALSIKVSE